jgi:hypothetical protein
MFTVTSSKLTNFEQTKNKIAQILRAPLDTYSTSDYIEIVLFISRYANDD